MDSVKSFSWLHFPLSLTQTCHMLCKHPLALIVLPLLDCFLIASLIPVTAQEFPFVCAAGAVVLGVQSMPELLCCQETPLGNPCFHSLTHAHPSHCGHCRTGQAARDRSCTHAAMGPLLSQFPFHILECENDGYDSLIPRDPGLLPP